jgi:hypothetical protein
MSFLPFCLCVFVAPSTRYFANAGHSAPPCLYGDSTYVIET